MRGIVMNHIYRIVFNRSLCVYQCVSEIAKSAGKFFGRSATSNRQAGVVLSTLSIAMLSMISIGSAQATTYNYGYTGVPTNPYIVTNDIVEKAITTLKTSDAIVGDVGSGKLIIRNQGKVESTKMIVGNQLGSDGKLTVTGNGSALTIDDDYPPNLPSPEEDKLIIGNYGKGSVTIEKGGFVDVNQDVEIGNYKGAIGELIVTGSNSKLFMDDFLQLGNSGKGNVIIEDGALVGVGYQVVLGTNTSGLGELNVTGVGTRLLIGDDLKIGDAGKGSATIADGASVEAVVITISAEKDSEGKLTVTGTNSKLTAAGSLDVGDEGKGSATIADGASVKAADVYIGLFTDAEGNLTVTGSNSKLSVGSDLTIGNAGKGSTKISKGGLVQAINVSIGEKKGSEGKLTVTGNNSQLSNGYLVIGRQGKGTLNIIDNGLVIAKNVGRDNRSKLSVINFDKGTLALTPGPSLPLFNNFTTANTINLASGGGTIDTNEFDVTVFDDARITGSGNFTKAGTGKLVMNSATKAWTGTTNINQGILELKGDYNMREDEVLGIGLNSLTDYGQLKVTGNADISRGTLQVNAADAVQALTGSPVWNNVISANSLNSKFSAINDNSPLVSFVADYSDANTVHLKMTAPVTPPVDPVNNLIIGKEGKESTTIANGKLVQAIKVSIGENAGSEGNLTVTGTNSKLIADNLNVGVAGKGTLNIIDNGLVVAKNVSRNKSSQLSVINFDNGTLELLSSEPSPLLSNNFNNRTLALSAQDPSSLLFNNFTAANTINLASGGGTIDTNEFDVTVFDDARITGSGNFTKAGTGKLVMNSATKAWTGTTNINQGILELKGDYNMREDEVLGIGLNSLTDYGQLKVTGNADISRGTLQVNAADAVQALTGSPVWNNVISANSLNSKFSAINDNSPLVSFVADYSDANTVHLKMTAPVTPPVDPVDPPVTDTTFVKAVESQANQTALGLAGALDQAIQDRVNNGNNALADALISNTLNFNNLKLAAAANELQPLLMGATNRIIADTNYAAAEAVTERSITTPNRGVWAKIIGNDSSNDDEGGITGYDADNYGAIVGIDTPINDNLNFGVAFSYIESDVDSNSRTINHEMTAKNWQILGYGNYAASESTQVNFHAGAGSSDVKGQRHITILTNATAESDYSADTLQAGFGISHRIGNDLRNFTPFAQMNYARAESDGYRETGAGVYNLEVDENTYESLRWTAGVKMSQALTPKLALTGQLAAAIENGDRRSDITASFIGMPDANFTTIGQEIGREIGIVGIGLSYMPTVNTKLAAGYRGEWRDNYNDQGASIALQTTF